MPGRQYIVPPTVDMSEVVNLLPEHTKRAPMQPTTPVICVNRGPHTIEDKHDGEDYVIPPFCQFQVVYAAAVHFQKRQIVPGTRNPDISSPGAQYLSWIGILGVDPDEACEPFSDADLEHFGEAVEGLDRSRLPTAVDRAAEVRSTKELGRALPGLGHAPSAQAMAAASDGPGGLSQEVIGGSDENRDALTDRVTGSDAVTEDASGRAAGFTGPAEAQLRVRSDDAPRQKDLAPPAPPIGRGKRDRG